MGSEKADTRQFLVAARAHLGMTQRELGHALGASERTASRWESGRSHLSATQFHELAARLYPLNDDLAAQAAQRGSQTLEGLGLKVAIPAPVAAVITPAPAPPVFALAERVDLVVLAAIEAGDVPARVARRILAAAFGRARELDVTVADAGDALAAAGARREKKKKRTSPAS